MSAKKTSRQARGKTVALGIYEAVFTKRAVEAFITSITSGETEWKDPMFQEDEIVKNLESVVTKIDGLSYFATPAVTNGGETTETSETQDPSTLSGETGTGEELHA
jgi:hypothetical protein